MKTSTKHTGLQEYGKTPRNVLSICDKHTATSTYARTSTNDRHDSGGGGGGGGEEKKWIIYFYFN